MKTIFAYLIVWFSLMMSLTTGQTQTKITGFFDVIHSYNFTMNENSGFRINQFELDLSFSYCDYISMAAAIAHNNEENKVEAALAYLHYNFFSKKSLIHPHKEESMPHTGLLIGKFDIPFGIDYLSFASPDRPIISQPIIIEKTIGYWTDIGVNFHIVNKKLCLSLSAVNGFNNGINIGGNFKISSIPFFQIGLGHRSDFVSLSNRRNWINTLFLISEQKNWEIKSEYIWTQGLLDGAQDTLRTPGNHKGFYLQTVFQLKDAIRLPFFLTLRYGFWRSDMDSDQSGKNDQINRYTQGLGYWIHDNCSVRMEIRTDQFENHHHHNIVMQMVINF
ncbi:hypothetical protein B6D60_07720 [candidate division KSB1 bacterium 4484_87]|nr:MAG: hypothetical protein B6D60_07720 [candidate division KSB1 bacterium 4484_87]